MTNRLRHSIAAGVVLAGALLSVTGAIAETSVVVVRDDPVVNQLKTFEQNLTKALTDDLKKHAEQNTAGTQASVAAQSRIADAQAGNMFNLFRSLGQSMTEGGQYDASPSMCSTASSLPTSTSIQGGGGGFSAPIVGAQTGASPNPNNPISGKMSSSDAIDDQRNWERGNGYPEIRDGIAAIAKKIMDNRTKYANAFPRILDPTTDARAFTNMPTLPNEAGDSKQQALSALAKNLFSPTPPQPLQESQAATAEGAVEIANRETIRARRSVAYAVYEHLLGEQMAVPGMTTGSLDMPSNYPAQPTSDVSFLTWVDINVWSKYLTPEWYSKTLASSPAAVNREVAIVTALNALVNWRRYQLERKVALLQAAQFTHALDRDVKAASPN